MRPFFCLSATNCQLMESLTNGGTTERLKPFSIQPNELSFLGPAVASIRGNKGSLSKTTASASQVNLEAREVSNMRHLLRHLTPEISRCSPSFVLMRGCSAGPSTTHPPTRGPQAAVSADDVESALLAGAPFAYFQGSKVTLRRSGGRTGLVADGSSFAGGFGSSGGGGSSEEVAVAVVAAGVPPPSAVHSAYDDECGDSVSRAVVVTTTTAGQQEGAGGSSCGNSRRAGTDGSRVAAGGRRASAPRTSAPSRPRARHEGRRCLECALKSPSTLRRHARRRLRKRLPGGRLEGASARRPRHPPPVLPRQHQPRGRRRRPGLPHGAALPAAPPERCQHLRHGRDLRPEYPRRGAPRNGTTHSPPNQRRHQRCHQRRCHRLPAALGRLPGYRSRGGLGLAVPPLAEPASGDALEPAEGDCRSAVRA